MGQNKAHGNRQRQHVNGISRRYPNAWAQADALRREQRQTWPDWCYLPIRHWRDMAQAVWPNREPTVDRMIDVGRLAALGAWRVTQGIYRFDPDLYAALIDTPLSGDLPDELLYRLPSWGIYVETPGLSVASRPIIGYYAHLNQHQDGHTDLRLLIDSDAETGLLPVPIPLGQGSLLDALHAYINVARDTFQQQSPEKLTLVAEAEANLQEEVATLQPLLSLLLYLCADDADYERPPRLKTARPRGLGKQRIAIIPENASYWDVGTQIGVALRTARDAAVRSSADLSESSDRAKPRPHGRRAYWHTFWTEPLDGERTARIQWLPPIAVNVDAHDLPLPTVIHPVTP
jgi:hypothetical protein